MPVFLVLVNGRRRALPEMCCVVCSKRTKSEAVAYTLERELIFVRDLEVVQLSARNDCWFAQGGDA